MKKYFQIFDLVKFKSLSYKSQKTGKVMQTLIIVVDVVCGVKKVENHCSKAKCYHPHHHKYKNPLHCQCFKPKRPVRLSVYS